MRRDYRITRSYRLAFILDGFYGVLQLAVAFFISRTFKDAGPGTLDGAPDYFAFAAVGIIIALIVESASEGLAERVRDGQLTGTLEYLLTQPLNVLQLCAGLVSFPFLFAVLRALVYLVIAGIWMGLDVGRTDWVGLAIMFLTSAAAMAGLGILAGALVLVWKRGQMVSGMVLFGMALLGGSVFPVSSLPDWLAQVGSVLPLRFAFDGVREALFQGYGWEPEALGLIAYAAVGGPLAIWIFGRALEAAREAGSLGQY